MFKSETHFAKACTIVFASFQFRQFAFNCKSFLCIRCIIDLECCQSPISTMCLAIVCCELVCNTHIVHRPRLISIALHFSVFCTSYARACIALHCIVLDAVPTQCVALVVSTCLTPRGANAPCSTCSTCSTQPSLQCPIDITSPPSQPKSLHFSPRLVWHHNCTLPC